MNMRLNFAMLMLVFSVCCVACGGDVITVRYDGSSAAVSGKEMDSVKVKTDGARVVVESEVESRELTFRLVGATEDGQFVLKSKGKAKVELDGVSLQSKEGAPLYLKTKKKVDVEALKGTENVLSITACKDTANEKAAVIYAKGKLHLMGEGKLVCLATGDGCRGVQAKKDITIKDLTLDVKTMGNNLGAIAPQGGFGGFGPGGPDFNMDDMPEDVKKHIEEMKKMFENGDFPMGPPPPGMGGGPGFGPGGPDGHGFGPGGPGFGMGMMIAGPPEGEGPEDLFPEEEEEGMMGFGPMKRKYAGTCKGIKSNGKVTINSGCVRVYTASRGAEGIEGKEGVVINGGTVDVNSMDDAINTDGAVYFNGGKTVALSRGNDAVDANPEGGFFPPFFGGEGGEQKEQEPLIFINGGEVYAYSWVGAPEEGLDCDFNPISVSGGTAFSIGAGMGEMPSVPTQKTATQPTVLLVGLNLVKGKPVVLKDAKGKVLMQTDAPFSFNNSSSLLTSPELKLGEKYVIESNGAKKEFEVKEKFSVIR